MDDYRFYTDPVGIALILFSIAGLALIVERVFAWSILRQRSRTAVIEFQEAAAAADRDALQSLADESDAPLGEVLGYVLKHGVTDSPETMQLLLEDALDHAVSGMKKNQIYLVCLAGTAPFLGLLGTVRGIMNTFTSINKQGFGGTTVISAGIAMALQTTAVGLMIAIPVLIAYNLFNNKANEAGRELRMQANRMLVALGDL